MKGCFVYAGEDDHAMFRTSAGGVQIYLLPFSCAGIIDPDHMFRSEVLRQLLPERAARPHTQHLLYEVKDKRRMYAMSCQRFPAVREICG